MRKIVMIVAMVVVMAMPMAAEAHEFRGTITFKDVINEVESWDIVEEYEEHLVSCSTQVDFENEEYDKHFYFDEECEYDYAYIIVHTWDLGDGPKHEEVFMCAVYRDGTSEIVKWESFDEFADEYGVWGSEE